MASFTKKENITPEDIRDFLNSYGGSVSSDPESFFTTAAKINMLSKHKPVAYSKDFCQDFDASKPDYDPTWWKGNDGMCGLNIPTTNAMVSSTSSDKLWTYNLPKGGTSEPFRLGDFIGYTPQNDANTPDLILPRPTTIRIDNYTTNFGDVIIGNDYNRVCALDIFDKICMSMRAEGKSTIITSEITPVVSNKLYFSFTSSQKAQLGAVEGGYVNYHFYGKMKDGTLRSLRYNNSAVTVDKMRVFSNKPYEAKIGVDSVVNAGYGIYVYNLRFILDASYCAGNINEQESLYNTAILIYPYNGENYSDYEDSRTTPVMRTVMLNADLRVAEGQIVEHSEGYEIFIDTDVLVRPDNLTKLMFIWKKLNGEAIAKLAVNVS